MKEVRRQVQQIRTTELTKAGILPVKDLKRQSRLIKFSRIRRIKSYQKIKDIDFISEKIRDAFIKLRHLFQVVLNRETEVKFASCILRTSKKATIFEEQPKMKISEKTRIENKITFGI